MAERGPSFIERLHRLGACNDALKWVAGKTLQKAWAACHYPGWMIWLAARVGTDEYLEQVMWDCCLKARHEPLRYYQNALRRCARADVMCDILTSLPSEHWGWIADYLRQRIDVEEIERRLIDG